MKNLSIRNRHPRIIPFPSRSTTVQQYPSDDPVAERAYRAACITLVHATLNGAPPIVLKYLAAEMWKCREKFMGQQTQGFPTGDHRPSR